jgi:hypothetical protein
MGQINDTDGIEGTLPYTYTASRTERFIDRRFSLAFLDFDGIRSTPNKRTVLDTEKPAVLWLTPFRV